MVPLCIFKCINNYYSICIPGISTTTPSAESNARTSPVEEHRRLFNYSAGIRSSSFHPTSSVQRAPSRRKGKSKDSNVPHQMYLFKYSVFENPTHANCWESSPCKQWHGAWNNSFRCRWKFKSFSSEDHGQVSSTRNRWEIWTLTLPEGKPGEGFSQDWTSIYPWTGQRSGFQGPSLHQTLATRFAAPA